MLHLRALSEDERILCADAQIAWRRPPSLGHRGAVATSIVSKSIDDIEYAGSRGLNAETAVEPLMRTDPLVIAACDAHQTLGRTIGGGWARLWPSAAVVVGLSLELPLLIAAGDHPALAAQADDTIRQGQEAGDRGVVPTTIAAWRKAAEAGSAVAQNELGLAFQTGRGAPRDYAEALKWYRMAAEQGDAEALTSVGWFYQNGWGAPQDDAEAFRWYNKAADKDYAPAMTNLASLYEKGKGTPRDFAAALKWYQAAWEHGADKWAAYRLGQFYENGWGVEKDAAVAKFWNTLASGPAAMCG
jgi:TPR repeat protein